MIRNSNSVHFNRRRRSGKGGITVDKGTEDVEGIKADPREASRWYRHGTQPSMNSLAVTVTVCIQPPGPDTDNICCKRLSNMHNAFDDTPSANSSLLASEYGREKYVRMTEIA